MAQPDDANRASLCSPSLPSCVSMVKKWLDYMRTGTRRFYLFGLITVRSPNRLYLSPPLSALGLERVSSSVPVRWLFKRAGYTHTSSNVW